MSTDFYPRPPGGGRQHPCGSGSREKEFLSTPSGWRATLPRGCPPEKCDKFLSTPSGWRATSLHRRCRTKAPNFYPRPPGGGRPRDWATSSTLLYFYPRPPGGGRPGCTVKYENGALVFLSTPSGWRATLLWAAGGRAGDNFYPRPPGGGRQSDFECRRRLGEISIHALRVEGDHDVEVRHTHSVQFLSTPSGWRATRSKFAIS